MSESVQTFKNHTKFDPSFHFFLVPTSFFLWCWSVVGIYRHMTSESVIVSAGLFLLVLTIFKMRIYSLKVQDRVIRLEERLRLAGLCSEMQRGRIPELTEKQLIALRFASDSEAAALVSKALDEKMEPKQIKAAIQKWRPDHFRV